MSTVTTLLNLVKPAKPEKFSLATYTSNLDAIDAAAMLLTTAKSTFKNTYWDATPTNFTKIANATKGIVVARFEIINLKATTIPSYTDAYNMIAVGGTVIPAGFRPRYKLEGFTGGISGASVGGALEGIVSENDLGLRALAQPTSFLSTVNSRYFFTLTYEWGGS